MRWVLLLRGINVGGNNTVPMKDLKTLLEDLGHTEVKTYLNSGNATFESSRRSAAVLAGDVEEGLVERLGLAIRACVRTGAQIAQALDELPDLPGYVVVGVLFDRPRPAALLEFLDMSWPDVTTAGNDQVLYLGYRDGLHNSKLTNARIEKLLGVGCTARTPATLRKLLA